MSEDTEYAPLIAAIPVQQYGVDIENDDDRMGSFVVNNVAGETGKKLPQIIAGLAATGGALAAGAVLGWTSPAGPILRSNSTEFPISESDFSWIGSIVNLGAAFVCIPIGIMMNSFGRKYTMLSLIIPFTIGWAFILKATTTVSVPMFCIGRFLLGVAGGAFCVTAPMYTGEIAEKDIRGTLGSFFQLMVTIGILFVYAVGAAVDVFTLSVICGAIPLIFGAIFVFMPESPYYLVSKMKIDEASKSLKWLRGKQYDERFELEIIKRENEKLAAENVPLKQAFEHPAAIKGLKIALGLVFFQQMSGINAVIFYTTDIFEDANSGIDPQKATIIVGVIQVVATLVATLVIDKFGRRFLLLLSASVMALSTFVLGLYFYLKDQDVSKVANIGYMPIFALCLFIIMFSLGFGPVPWVVIGEIFAPNIKNFAAPLVCTLNWLLAFLITKIYADLKEVLGTGETFWVFSGSTIVGTCFVLFNVPETKNIPLCEIPDMLLGKRVPRSSDTEKRQ